MVGRGLFLWRIPRASLPLKSFNPAIVFIPPTRIRPEEAADVEGIHAVNAAAFETPAEAELVALLRAQASTFISLVAEEDGLPVTSCSRPCRSPDTRR